MADLFPYQVEGANWLAKKRFAYLADEMGLGKTAQVVTACDLVDAQSILVVCPAVVRFNWRNEFELWSSRARRFDVATESTTLAAGPFVICSYDLAVKNTDKLAKKYDVICLDEAHYVKNPDAERTRAIFGKDGLARAARKIWLCSGTPTPNHLGELWVPLRCAGKTDLGYPAFLERYTIGRWHLGKYRPIGNTRNGGVLEELKQGFEEILLRRTKRQVGSELPGIVFGDFCVPSSRRVAFPSFGIPWRQAGYDAQALQAAAGQMSGYRREMGLRKAPAVAELVSADLTAGAYQKIVLFAIHRDVIACLQSALAGFNPAVIHGGTSFGARNAAIDAFQTNPKCQVFIGNIQAAGVGINLTAAHHVVMVEADWVPGNNAQAIMRCHRHGQREPVTVRFIQLENDPLDRLIQRTLRRKTRELSGFYGDKATIGANA